MNMEITLQSINELLDSKLEPLKIRLKKIEKDQEVIIKLLKEIKDK